MTMTQVKTIQTRDCYYPIYKDNNNEYWFFDLELVYRFDGFFGPYDTIDEACKKQAKYFKEVKD